MHNSDNSDFTQQEVNELLELFCDLLPPQEDDRDPSEKPCLCGELTARDCDGRPCGFIPVFPTEFEFIPCDPELSIELGYEED